jgi:hypothetical protein
MAVTLGGSRGHRLDGASYPSTTFHVVPLPPLARGEDEKTPDPSGQNTAGLVDKRGLMT